MHVSATHPTDQLAAWVHRPGLSGIMSQSSLQSQGAIALQCNQVARLPGSGMPIQQIALSQPQADSQAPSATQAAHYFIAIRAHFWLCFATISGPAEDAAAGSTQTADAPDNHQADSAWQLQALYASQSHVRLAHVAWNRRWASHRPRFAAVQHVPASNFDMVSCRQR